MFFRLIYAAFVTKSPDKIGKDERRYYAEIQTALESVSQPIGDLPDDAEFDMRNRRLSGPGSCLLSARAFERLVTTIEESPYHAAVSRYVEELLEHLSEAERVDSEGHQLKAV